MRHDTMRLNPGWFMSSLRPYCRHVYVDVSHVNAADFAFIKPYRFDAASFSIGTGESAFQNLLNGLAHARALETPRVICLDVSSLSLATTAVCEGAALLGGETIHSAVAAPDNLYRYQSGNLFIPLQND